MIIQAKEGLRMYKRAQQVRKNGFRKYTGTPEEICRQIIEDAYDTKNEYFRVSSGHFCEYYIRDFAFCCEALQRLGHKEKVRKTLQYALTKYVKAGKITTAINPEGIPFDYHMPTGPESIGLFLYSLRITGNEDLAHEHKEFLQTQVDRVQHMIKDLLPREDKSFSTIRDQAVRKASCYDAVMVAVVARESTLLGLTFAHSEEEITKKIIATYWNGIYFFQDLHKQNIVAGDANTFPFWTGIITDKAMLDNAITSIRAAQLDDPFPLRYVSPVDKTLERTKLHFSAMLAPDYETDSIWVHLGLAYLQVLAKHDPALAKKQLAVYTQKVRQHKNFLEIYDTHGEPLKRSLYISDEAMVWCANYLTLLEDLGKA